jgi:hypothetical protein
LIVASVFVTVTEIPPETPRLSGFAVAVKVELAVINSGPPVRVTFVVPAGTVPARPPR